MIIRSQDRKKIINFNQITNIATMFNSRLEEWEVYVCYPYCSDAECGYSIIAYYPTEEKAIKVLDMIQKRYSEFCCNKFCSVFEMPQDSEV